ncbi:HAD family hydrolase [Weissella hellenica]|nr:HAD family hydrolase [Weissella hellenica]
MIKQIFLDMDGTLLDAKGDVTQQTIDTIKTANIPVTLVSARAPQEMTAAIDQLELNAPQVAFNGGLIYQWYANKMHVLGANTIAREVSKQLMEWLLDNYPAMSLSYYTQDEWIVSDMSPEVSREIEFTGLMPLLLNTATFSEDVQNGIFKIMLIDLSGELLDDIQAAILALDLTGVNVQQSDKEHLEITSHVAEKARGVAYIVEQEGLNKSETAAFGDGQNDLSMFDEVGVAIAMGNAPLNVRQAGDYVTKTNRENGVAYGIQQILLHQDNLE